MNLIDWFITTLGVLTFFCLLFGVLGLVAFVIEKRDE